MHPLESYDSHEVLKNDVAKLTRFCQVTKALNCERCITFRGTDEEFLRPLCIEDGLCEGSVLNGDKIFITSMRSRRVELNNRALQVGENEDTSPFGRPKNGSTFDT